MKTIESSVTNSFKFICKSKNRIIASLRKNGPMVIGDLMESLGFDLNEEGGVFIVVSPQLYDTHATHRMDSQRDKDSKNDRTASVRICRRRKNRHSRKRRNHLRYSQIVQRFRKTTCD